MTKLTIVLMMLALVLTMTHSAVVRQYDHKYSFGDFGFPLSKPTKKATTSKSPSVATSASANAFTHYGPNFVSGGGEGSASAVVKARKGGGTVYASAQGGGGGGGSGGEGTGSHS